MPILKHPSFTLALSALCLLAACSGKPGNGELQSEIQAKYDEMGLAEVCKVDSVEKLNGFDQNDRTYVVDVKYDITFSKSEQEARNDLAKQMEAGQIAAAQGLGIVIRSGGFAKGTRRTLTDKLTLIKTEKVGASAPIRRSRRLQCHVK